MRSFSTTGHGRGALTVFDHDPQQERLVQVEDQQQPDETDAVLLHQGLHFPVNITEWIFEEASNVLERSPLLGHITRLSCSSDELSEITVCLFCKCSIIRRL
jgi:hypothetical protein